MILRNLLPALLLLTSLPLAAASNCDDVPGVRVCAGEWSEGQACAQPESLDWGYTYAELRSHDGLVGAQVEGSYECWRFEDGNGGEERFRSEDVRASVRVDDKRVTLAWVSYEWTNGEDSETGCAMLLTTRGIDGQTEDDLGCPAGAPPQMDWGRLLA